jgi:hypothetical protein
MRLASIIIATIIVVFMLFYFLNKTNDSVRQIRQQIDSTADSSAQKDDFGIGYARDAVKKMNETIERHEKELEGIGR